MGGVLAAAAAALVAQGSGSGVLGGFVKALNQAEGLTATYTIQKLGGAPDTYKVSLAKPNKARIETPTQVIVADGTTIVTFDKQANQYIKRAQTPAGLRSLFTGDETNIWAGFFNAEPFKGMNAKALPDKTRKGVQFKVVEITAPDNQDIALTLYVNPADNLARQAEMTIKAGSMAGTKILDTKSLELKKEADTVFAFAPPAGSKEVTEAELNTDKWYTDLDEALRVAKATNRLVFVDFGAVW
jgi:outer membrane lipoprotein-sorting protein